jgi:hypothetical protein
MSLLSAKGEAPHGRDPTNFNPKINRKKSRGRIHVPDTRGGLSKQALRRSRAFQCAFQVPPILGFILTDPGRRAPPDRRNAH